MTDSPLHRILRPRSVVVAGASSNLRKMGTIQALNLLGAGFEGEVVFVHPRERQILGRPAYPSPADLPTVPEVALLVTPTSVTPELLDGLGARGVRSAVVTTAGFSEVGGEGEARARDLRAAARRHGIRYVGPNCIGVMNTHHHLNMTVAPTMTAPGPLALVSQSGTFVAQTQFWLRERGVRLSKAISVGNAYDIDLADCLAYLAADPETAAIALYVEGLRDGARFLEVARRVTRTKPIVALYIGGTEAGARAGRSHTAALAGPDRLYQGLFEQAGVLRASTIEELFSWGWGLAAMPRPRGRRVAILTHSGGPAACMADECERQGLGVPTFSAELQDAIRPDVPPTGAIANPIDLTFTLETEGFARRLPELLFASDEIDAVLIHGLMDTGFVKGLLAVMARFFPVDGDAVMRSLRLDTSVLVELPQATGKPLVGSTFVWDDDAARGLKDAGVPLVPCPQAAARIMGALARADDVTRRPEWAPSPVGTEPVAALELDALSPGADVVLDEAGSKRVLARYGAPVPQEHLCASFDEAVVAAEALGWPVVLKGLPAGVAHKTEAGLVHLALTGHAALSAAWEAVERAAPGCPRLVAPMLRGARELAVGMTRFEGFGPVIMLGQGGILTEALGDATFRVAPLSRWEAEGALDSLRSRAIYGAVRGLPAVDRGALADLLLAVARLALDHPEVAEVDVNPVIIVGDQPLVADAMIRVRR